MGVCAGGITETLIVEGSTDPHGVPKPRVPQAQRSPQRPPPTAACAACVDDDHLPPTELRQHPGPLQLE